MGYVTAVDLKGSTAIVRFQLDDGVSITPRDDCRRPLPKPAGAAVCGAHQCRTRRRPGVDHTGALNKTVPSFDVSTLFNSFKPVFDTLNTAEINELQSNLLRVAQGGTVEVSHQS